MISGLVIISCLVPFVLKAQGDLPKKKFQIHLAGGIKHSAERDQAFSSLVYSGWKPSVMAGLEIRQTKKTELFLISYNSGELANRFGNVSESSSINMFNYTLYHKGQETNENFNIGWSNNNNVTWTDFDEAKNFSPRFSYLTSFGVAGQYRHTFSGKFSGLTVEAVAHLQLIGFKLQSSYVSASPSGYEGNYSSGFSAAWNSMELFYLFKNWNWGLWPALRYTFKTGNSINFKYRYDMLILNGAHRTSNSSGNYLITITTLL